MTSSTAPQAGKPAVNDLAVMTLGALGVVFGDIGTSPLYAFRECFSRGLPSTEANILGVLSILFWVLILVISIEYLIILLRFDNKGEGGILVLANLATRSLGDSPKLMLTVATLGLIGASMICGDGIITPAISVLSAVEGLNVATDFFQSYVVWIALAVLVVLFLFQGHGTGKIGAVFGPVMLVWFATLALIGLSSTFMTPKVLLAVNPLYAIEFLANHTRQAFAILGAVFLAITGAEVLYADLGHFGRKPIRAGWFAIALPALLLNYCGQAACLLRDSQHPDNLFYRTAPEWALYPLVALATLATVIASQAVISGTFSLARQAFQFGFWPRMRIVHTSHKAQGQVYMPDINFLLLLGTVALVLGFRSSGNLANAYGIAVSGTMISTTIIAIVVARKVWKLPLWTVALGALVFLPIDTSFFLSCMTKIASGGWIPIVVAATIFLLSSIWREGRAKLAQFSRQGMYPMEKFVEDVRRTKPIRVKGTAVFLSGNRSGVPRILLHNIKHNRVLHDITVLLCVEFEDVPFIPEGERHQVEILGEGLYRVVLRFGFSESPDVPEHLREVKAGLLDLSKHNISYFLGRECLALNSERGGMSLWKKNVFGFLSRNASDASRYFNIPPDRLTEFGIGVEL